MAILSLIIVLSTLLSAVISLGLAFYAWQQQRVPGAKAFAFVMAGASIWAFAYSVMLVTFDPTLRRIIDVMTWTGKGIIPIAWLIFALQYTGRGELVQKKVVFLLSLMPALTIPIILIEPLQGLMWIDYEVVKTAGLATAKFIPGPWLIAGSIYVYILNGVSLLIIFGLMLFEGEYYRDQAIALMFGTVIGMLASFKWLLNIGPLPELDFTPLAFSMTSLLFGYAVFRYDLFRLVPASQRVGRRAVIDDFNDGVVIVDEDGHIQSVNEAAMEIFSIRTEDIVGQPLNSLPMDNVITLEPGHQSIRVENQAGFRDYELTISTVEDEHNQPIGYTLAFRDITEREQRRQRLQVLNRVLRHNLRNDMNVIQGCAQLITNSGQDPEAMAEQIIDHSTKLLELGTKAREIERMIASQDGSLDLVDLSKVIKDIEDEFREKYPDACVETDLPETLEMETNERTLMSVIKSVVENGIEHNDETNPRVEIVADAEEFADRQRVRVVIADNGPGVPRHEWEVIAEGEENPLKHGSGLGLWLVKWGVTSLGGEISLTDNDPHGTKVTIILPRTSPAISSR